VLDAVTVMTILLGFCTGALVFFWFVSVRAAKARAAFLGKIGELQGELQAQAADSVCPADWADINIIARAPSVSPFNQRRCAARP